jgi:hypothetical protein
MKAPLFLFGLVALVEKNMQTPDRYSSHPPAQERLAHLAESSKDRHSRNVVRSMIDLVKTTPVLNV